MSKFRIVTYRLFNGHVDHPVNRAYGRFANKADCYFTPQVKNTNKYTLYSSSRIGLQRLFKHYERTCQVVFRKHIGHTHLVSAKTGCGVEP